MKVAVIGAGASGITALKECVDEGLDVVCFERTDEIGGLWNYTENVRYGQACVAKSTVINTSKEMMSYSDFPIPKEMPMYLTNRHVNEYFNLYVDNFNLRKLIKFEHEILHMKQAKDFDTTGKWDIRVKNNKTDKVEDLVFDAVMVCTGHHAYPNMAEFPGQKEFQGTIIHSHDYKHPKGYEGKRTVVVGVGNSGVDTAVELSRVCSQVFLVTRRGTWVFSRTTGGGAPADMTILRRYARIIQQLLPKKLIIHLTENWLNSRIDHARYGLKPKHNPFAAHATMNDDLPTRIMCGSIKVKPNIKRFTKTGVEFEDGTFEENIDHVIMATGYVFGFPFIDKSVLEVKSNNLPLYKRMFHPEFKKHTLAFIGFFQPLGALMPVVEMQSRLATRLFKGKITLPSREDMWDDIKMKNNALKERYVQTDRHTMQVDVIDFTDQLAEIVGCKPNLVKLFFTDPKLWYNCFFEPCAPYQYRLHGPGKWDGARKAIFGVWERTYYSMKTRPVSEDGGSNSILFYIAIVFILLLAYAVRIFFL